MLELLSHRNVVINESCWWRFLPHGRELTSTGAHSLLGSCVVRKAFCLLDGKLSLPHRLCFEALGPPPLCPALAGLSQPWVDLLGSLSAILLRNAQNEK